MKHHITQTPHAGMRSIARLLPIIAMCMAALTASAAGAKAELPESELRQLDIAMREASRYSDSLYTEISRLKQKEASETASRVKSIETDIRIASIYRPVNADSAMKYAYRAWQLCGMKASDPTGYRSALAFIDALSTAGLFVSATEGLDSLRHIPADREMKIRYWTSGRQLYSYMLSYLTSSNQFSEIYRQKYIAFDDSLINNLPPTDKYCRFLKAERLVAQGHFDAARKDLEYLLTDLDETSNLYGMAAYQLAEVFRNRGDETAYAAFLAKAAVSDIKSGVTEGLALPMLANWMYEQGRLDDAFRYINFALEGSMKGNTRMRTVTIAGLVPIIDEAYRSQIRTTNSRLTFLVLITSLLLISAVVLLLIVYRQRKRAHEANVKIAEMDRTKDSYIGNFVGLCSSYAGKLDSLTKMVTRKIAAGQTDELMKLLKSGRYGQDDNDDFYKTFDTAFLDICPDFVFEINKLLRPEEQIMVKKGAGLPAELRIYALVRLGVTESTRISQILNYSVSTIYTYRNRMRNKAICRDTFEESIATIGRYQA